MAFDDNNRYDPATGLDAREAVVLGKPQRIEPLGVDEVGPEGRAFVGEIYAAFGQSAPEGDVPATYRLMMRHAGLFRPEVAMIVQLLTKSEIPPRERELIVLRVLWLCGAPNPYGEHVAMAKMVGVTQRELEDMKTGSSAPGWSEIDAAMLKATEDLLETQLVSDEDWAVLERHWTDKQLLEFPVVVGQYFASAVLHNSIRTRMSDYNNGFRHRID